MRFQNLEINSLSYTVPMHTISHLCHPPCLEITKLNGTHLPSNNLYSISLFTVLKVLWPRLCFGVSQFERSKVDLQLFYDYLMLTEDLTVKFNKIDRPITFLQNECQWPPPSFCLNLDPL